MSMLGLLLSNSDQLRNMKRGHCSRYFCRYEWRRMIISPLLKYIKVYIGFIYERVGCFVCFVKKCDTKVLVLLNPFFVTNMEFKSGMWKLLIVYIVG